MKYTKEQIKAKVSVVLFAGLLLWLALLFFCIALGFMFGAQWGLIAVSSLIGLTALSLIVLLAIDKKLAASLSDKDASEEHKTVA